MPIETGGHERSFTTLEFYCTMIIETALDGSQEMRICRPVFVIYTLL
jgi:hypothetical protein